MTLGEFKVYKKNTDPFLAQHYLEGCCPVCTTRERDADKVFTLMPPAGNRYISPRTGAGLPVSRYYCQQYGECDPVFVQSNTQAACIFQLTYRCDTCGKEFLVNWGTEKCKHPKP